MAANSQCTILVASCDAYADVLGHFETLFSKFWPDCPFDTVLVTETRREQDRFFTRQVACGKGMDWSAMLVKALDSIATDRVALLMDDYYLSERVDTPRFLARLADARRLGAASLRLIPNPGCFRRFDDEFGAYAPGTAYCVSCQVSIWDKGFLRSIAAQTTSAWEFERRGSYLCGGEERPMLVTRRREFPFVDAVHKGCWERFAVKLCEDNGIAIDFSRRPLPSFRRRISEAIKALVFHAFPKDWIVRTQNALGYGATGKT